MAKRKKKKKLRVFVEVLQNGGYLADTSRSYHRRSNIILSSKSGDLVLPFYPLRHDFKIVTIDKSGAHVHLDATWKGFFTTNGQVKKVREGNYEEQIFTLRDGDYGSVARDDLRIMIRVGQEHAKHQVDKNPAFRGKPFPLWIGSALEGKILALGAACTAIVFAGLIMGLINRPDDRPTRKTDLQNQYNLAFVNSGHLLTLPEATKLNLDRSAPLKTAMEYYNAFTNMMLGYDLRYNKWMFSNSVDLYRRLHQHKSWLLREKMTKQSALEEKVIDTKSTAMIHIPVVQGASLSSKVLALSQKLRTLHKNFDHSLKLRLAATERFNADPGYDFGKFKGLGVSREMQKKLGKINVFGRLTNEEAMYHDARMLAFDAHVQQNRIKQHREEPVFLNASNAAAIVIRGPGKHLAFTPLTRISSLNTKVPGIHASVFGKQFSDKIKEPLIGEITPALIEKVVEKNRFQIRLCYELALRRDQLVSGKMEWQWRLDSRGKISDVQLLSSTIKDRRMTRCIRRKISGWSFPRPRKGSVEIRYPFTFKSANDEWAF